MNKYNAASSALRRRRRAAGLCTECGGARGGQKLRCPTCLAKQRQPRSSAWLCPQAKDPRFRPAMTQAFERGIKWTLTEEEFTAARDAPCLYCGAEGTGLDREDPDLGYEPGNVASCCQMCNCAKNVLSGDEWRRIIGPAVEKLGRGNVWPTQNRYPSEEKRAQRDGVVAAWPFCTLIATIGTWAAQEIENARLEELIAERERLGLDEYGRTKEQVAEEHRARREAAEANRKRYVTDHIAKGLCTSCPSKALEGKRFCDVHGKYARDYYDKSPSNKGKNRCGLCGATGHTAPRCPERALLSQDEQAAWARETKATRERAWWQARAAQRREQGLCVSCGERESINGYECEACRGPTQAREQRVCWVCGATFETTVGALKKTCGKECETAVVKWRSDRKRFKSLGDHWPRWKQEMWLRLHPGHPGHLSIGAAGQ